MALNSNEIKLTGNITLFDYIIPEFDNSIMQTSNDENHSPVLKITKKDKNY